MNEDYDKKRNAAAGSDTGQTRREPGFSAFDDEEFEEPDRDTDYATTYREDDAELEEEDFPWEDDEDSDPEGREEDEDPYLADPEEDDRKFWRSESGDDDDDDYEEEEDAFAEQEPSYRTYGESPAGAEQEWRSESAYEEADGDGTEPETSQPWPLALFVVGAVAVLLLAGGIYGVVKQRSALEEEIRQLQASLATAVSPDEVAAGRAEIATLESRNGDLQARLNALALENRRLADTVAGLESQLEAQQEVLASKPAVKAPAPAATPKPPASKPAKPAASPPTASTPSEAAAAASTASAGWFVNFGSYTQQATAREWAARLSPAAGKVAVTTGAKEGRTFYRVRVVGLESREQAERTARQLEKEYDLSRLWVGKQ